MKLYKFELLLFLLLIIVNTTLSIGFVPKMFSFLKPIVKEITGQATEYALQKSLEKVIQSPTPKQPAKEIQGLDQIKQYLYHFGYLQQSGQFNNFLDQ